MDRILFSPNPSDRAQDFMVVNGNLMNDETTRSNLGKEIIDYSDLKKIFSDDSCTIYKGNDFIILKSLYKERDEASRLIYYVYKIDNKYTVDQILEHLEEDSKVIERTFDREMVNDVLSNIKKSKDYKVLVLALSAAILVMAGIYLILKK